jgi:5'-3' exonuclease
MKEYGIPPQNFLTHKIVVGDKGDNVPGVKGIAIKTLVKLFPALKENEVVELPQLIEECSGKGGKYADIYNFRHQLVINKQLMDLITPNIPEPDRERLDGMLLNPRNQYDPTSFLRLYNEDQIGKSIMNPQIWLGETFAKLAEYKLED